jgi:hypothetical protein
MPLQVAPEPKAIAVHDGAVILGRSRDPDAASPGRQLTCETDLMNRTPQSAMSPPAGPASPPAPEVDDTIWFEVEARDGTLTGTADRIVRRRLEPDGHWSAHEWRYADLRSLNVLDAADGGAIVIEPLRGPLVPVPISPDAREEAFQAATVLALLIARAQHGAALRPAAR